MNLEIRENDIRLTTDRETAEKLGAKYIKGSTYKLPKNLHAVKDLMKHSNNIQLKNLFVQMERQKEMLLVPKRYQDIEVPGFESLRGYQRVDMVFLSKLPHAAIFNQQRCGKTPTMLSLIRFKNYLKNLIVVPAGLKLQWAKECETWLHGTKVFVIKGGPKQREKIYQSVYGQESFVMIVSYDTLKQKDEIERIRTHTGVKSFDSMTVDEVHNIRNRKAQRTVAIKEMGKFAQHRYGLSGTPAVKGGADLFSILQFLYPKKFSSYWEFVERHFEMKKDFFSGGKQPTNKYIRKDELQDILAMIGTNRKRKEVMKWLPDKSYITIPLEMGQKQRKAYNDVLETFEFEEHGELKVDAPSVLAQMTRLRQICLAPSILGIKAPSAKEEFLVQWLQDNPEPVIIFSQFTSYLIELQKVLRDTPLYEKVVMIHGKLTGAEKQQSVDSFQSGKARILLANIDAGSVGFTIDRAETTIFLDKAWNPSVNEQAEDRMIPTMQGRVHKTQVISLVCEDSYDEKINLLLQHKHRVTEVVNSGGLKALDRLYKELKDNAPLHHISS